MKRSKVAEDGPVMKKFTCDGCGKEFPDAKHYFFGVASKYCVFCAKAPKRKTK